MWTAPCQVDRRKNKIVFSRISGMGSWNFFMLLPVSCGRLLAAGSSAYADAAGGCSNR